jgi:hypothetical protein
MKECNRCKGKGYNTYLLHGEPNNHECGWCHGTGKVPEDLSDYINFGDYCRHEIGMQCQYGSHYLCGKIPGYTNLGYDLRYLGYDGDYHSIIIHKDDAPIFKKRMEDHRKMGGWD